MSFSLVITEGQMTETDYETLLDKLAVDVRERSAGDFAIFARIAVECTGRALWTGSLSNGGTISKVIQAIEVYSDYNRGKGPRSCEVDLDGLIDVIYRVLCLDTIKHEREHWIANYLTLPY